MIGSSADTSNAQSWKGLPLWHIYLQWKYLPVFGQNLHCIICMKSLIVRTFFTQQNITVINQPNLTQYSCSIEAHAPKSFETLLVKVIELETNKPYSKILCVCAC